MPTRTPGKPTINSSEKRKGQKKLASPTSTGGSGVTYEARVQAIYLLAMFAAWPTPIQPDAEVIELRFQGRIHGYNTDDLVCTLRDGTGAIWKALLQIKLTLKALPSDTSFAEAVVAAWYDFNNASLFERGRDRLIIVYSRDADQSIHFANLLTRMARTSLTGAEFEHKATADGFSSKQHRSAYQSITSIVATELGTEPGLDAIHNFVRNLWFVHHELADDETTAIADIFGRIKFILGASLGTPRAIWSELTTACARLNKEAASLSFVNLDDQLSAALAKAFAKHRASAVSKLPVAELATERARGFDSPTEFAVTTAEDILLFSSSPVQRAMRPTHEFALSTSRDDSANRFITGQLDAINEKLKQLRCRDALEDLNAIGKDLTPFDAHQRARWYLQRGTCYWHFRDTDSAADDFIKASELYPDDEKMAAAGIRALLFRENVRDALEAGTKARERFPTSLTVWLTYTNARIVNGDALDASNIPADFRNEADALQIIAAARHQAKDFKSAVELSLQSLDADNAGYYSRNYALYYALEQVTANKVLSTYKLADVATKETLHKVIKSFEPRVERLWSIQAPESIAETAANLGVAHLLIGDNEGAMRLFKEAESRETVSPEMLRVAMEALLEADRIPEMLAFGRKHIEKLTEGSLVGLAQAAANIGELKVVEETIAAAEKLKLERIDTVEVLHAVRWMAMWNTGDREAVVKAALEADLASTDSLPLVIAGARVLRKSNPEIAAAAVSRGESLVAAAPTPEHQVLFADLLFELKELTKAAQYYEAILPRGQVSDLHNKLLHCYIQTGNRQKAKKLIESFPEGWVNNDDSRALAIELGQRVGDWRLLTVLADAQFERAPTEVSSWLFKFMVAIRQMSAADLRDFLEEAPLELEGSIQQISQFATQELRYGLREKGMQRMYRLRRLNTTDLESASALLLSFVSVPELLPNMEEVMECVVPGTHVVLVEENGQTIDITLDPSEVGTLPETDEFRNPQAADIARFLGLKPNDQLVIDGAFGSRRTLIVRHVSSAYRRLLNLAHEQMEHAITPVPNATSISIPTKPDGQADFTELHEQLKQQAAHIKESFHRYRTMPITLGGFCRLVGKSPIDAVRAWPAGDETPPLFVSGGTVDERAQALAQLQDTAAAYVVDAVTLTELVSLDIADSLKALSKVYATETTRDILHHSLEEAKLERSSGQIFDQDGQLGFVEHSIADHKQNVQQIERIVAILDTYCEVVPAYGPENSPEGLERLEKALSNEEHAVLRLAVEKGLCLLTVDGRLRNIASLIELTGVWPQVLAMHAVENMLLDQSTYSLACVRMFMSNRSFVSLHHQDVLMMCHQGPTWARMGIARFKKYLADPGTEFNSAVQITFEFLAAAAAACSYMGAIAELTRHLVEGLMRHKDHDEQVLDRMEMFMRGLLKGSGNPYAPVQEAENADQAAQLRYLAQAMVEGLTWSKEPFKERPVRLDVYFIGRTPWLASSA